MATTTLGARADKKGPGYTYHLTPGPFRHSHLPCAPLRSELEPREVFYPLRLVDRIASALGIASMRTVP